MSTSASPRQPLDIRGAVDLSALSRPAAPPPGEAAPTGVVVDLTEQSFAQVVQQSVEVPVIACIGMAGDPGSAELTATLTALATEYRGRFVLARVDAQAAPQVAQAFQVKAVPTAVAVVKGQPVPLFEGSFPADQVRTVIDQVLAMAAANGVTGTVPVQDDGAEQAEAEPEEPPLPPLHQAAYDAVEREDYTAAVESFRQALRENPRDEVARAGLAQVELLERTSGVDQAAVLAAAAQAGPADLAAQLAAADVEALAGDFAQAFARLVTVVRLTAGEDRETARTRLLDLFEVAGPEEQAVPKARRDLAAALF